MTATDTTRPTDPETIAETGGGIPDEAVGPGEMTPDDLADLARDDDDQATNALGRYHPETDVPEGP